MKFPRFNLWQWLWGRVWLLSERSGIGLGRFAPWVFHQMMGCDTEFKKDEIMDTRLTEAQLLFRLQEFSGAGQDAAAIGDHDFAHECADVVSIIRELQEYRKAAGEPVADVVAWSSPHEERKCDIRWRRLDVAPGPLFTSPQSMLVAPEIVPDALRDEIIDLCAGYEIGDQGAQEIWEACRAVMFASLPQEVKS